MLGLGLVGGRSPSVQLGLSTIEINNLMSKRAHNSEFKSVTSGNI